MPISASETSALLKFLDTGELGPIRPGMTQVEVRAFLGDPSRVSKPDIEFPAHEIYWYTKWLELIFNDSGLTSISLRYKWQKFGSRPLRHLKLPNVFHPDWAARVGSWNFHRSKNVLFSNGRVFRLVKAYDGSLAIEILGGSIIFDHSRRYGLHSIGFSTRGFRWRDAELCRPPRLYVNSKRKGRQR